MWTGLKKVYQLVVRAAGRLFARTVALLQAIQTHKDLFAAFQSIATIIALVVGAVWTYALTSQFRETVPRLAIKQDVSSWSLHDGTTLLRVDSTLTNTSKVRIAGVKGKMIVLRLLPETDQQTADYAAGRIVFSCKDASGKPLKDCVPDQGLNLPETSKKEFQITDWAGVLEPGESAPYWRYLNFDSEVSAIEVYTRIEKPGKPGDEWVFDSTFNLKK